MNEIGIILSILGVILIFVVILRRIERRYVDPKDIVKPVHKIINNIARLLLFIAFLSVIIVAISGIFEWIWVALSCLIAGLLLLGLAYPTVSQRQATINRMANDRRRDIQEQLIAECTQAITQDPQDVRAYYNRGLIYSRFGDFDRGIADFNKCLELDPKNHGAYVNRGLSYLFNKNPDQALLDINKAIALDLDDPEDHYNRGLVYLMKKDLDQALVDFDEYISLVSDNVDGYYKRAIVHYGKKDYDRALSDLDRALQINPNDAAVHLKRGEVYIDLGMRAKAISDLESARSLGLPPHIDQHAEELIQNLR